MAGVQGEAETSRNEHHAWTAACLAGQFVRHWHDLRGPSPHVVGDRGPRVTRCGGVTRPSPQPRADRITARMLNQSGAAIVPPTYTGASNVHCSIQHEP